jgi:DNA-binding transcriptional MerR regulator
LKSPDQADSDRLLPTSKVKRLLGVGATTLQEWDAAGILKAAQRTAGGHRRWRESDVHALVAALSQVAA